MKQKKPQVLRAWALVRPDGSIRSFHDTRWWARMNRASAPRNVRLLVRKVEVRILKGKA